MPALTSLGTNATFSRVTGSVIPTYGCLTFCLEQKAFARF
ncbi:hypothetical protein C4J95_1219 [Pseudomonas orientalis]|nr:hypothetical protein C4J96_1211 [Pseudomonas orientalis]AZE98697.1 hypothetical protein C4J95_1219 [Pseudomonas orientalis]